MKHGIAIMTSLMLVVSTALNGMNMACHTKPCDSPTKPWRSTGRSTGRSMEHQYTVIKPFFLNEKLIPRISEIMDAIYNNKLSYPDYSGRTGLIWSDLEIAARGNYFDMKECPETIKLTEALDGLQVRKTESVMSYPLVRTILSTVVLPKMITAIQEKKWANVSDSSFAQFFLQRCHSSEKMDWHQDPGEDYDRMADFSLILLLSKKDDPDHGWEGGMFVIKEGLPEDKYDKTDVTVVEPAYNQAFLFNNKLHSHAVTEVKGIAGKSKRDLMVVTLYLDGKRPKPITLPLKFDNDFDGDGGA